MITADFIVNGKTHLREIYTEELASYSDKALATNLKRSWIPDYNNKVTDENISNRAKAHAPGIGYALDAKLTEMVATRMAAGISLDNSTLRNLAMSLLETHDKLDLLRTNGGHMSLGDSWAQRFWIRHDFPSRGRQCFFIVL